MAKEKPLSTFSDALLHLKKGRKATREGWGRDVRSLQIEDTGLGNAGEFVRVDNNARPNRYVLATEDVLADDWRLM